MIVILVKIIFFIGHHDHSFSTKNIIFNIQMTLEIMAFQGRGLARRGPRLSLTLTLETLVITPLTLETLVITPLTLDSTLAFFGK
jgi:hypothetical protein